MQCSHFMFALAALFIWAGLTVGCGSASRMAPSSPAPPNNSGGNNGASPAGTATGTGSGSASGSAGSGSSGSQTPPPAPNPTPAPNPPNDGNPVAPTTAFVATLIGADGSNHGQISVNMASENGQTALQLRNATPNTFINVVFCPYPIDSGPKGNNACIPIWAHGGPTDSSGNASATFPFGDSGSQHDMAHGTWTGIFQVTTQELDQSGFQMPAEGTQFQAPFKACGSTSSLYSRYLVCGVDQLASGYLTVNGTNVHVSIRGALATATYVLSHCGADSKSSCPVLGTVSTDTNGNSDSDLNYQSALGNSAPPGPFLISRDDGSGTKTEFVTAFTIP